MNKYKVGEFYNGMAILKIKNQRLYNIFDIFGKSELEFPVPLWHAQFLMNDYFS